MSLGWFHRCRAGVAFITCVVFLHTTLRAYPAIAQAEAARAAAPPAQEASNPSASYDKSSRDALSKHVAHAGPASAGGSAEKSATPPAKEIEPAVVTPSGTSGGVSPMAASLPSGAATQLGMGESFTMQLSTGTAGYAVPLALPAARGHAQPTLALSYSSAAGIGIAGLGWSIGSPAVERQTDRGTPQYDDRSTWQPDQDRFVFAGMELVPICAVSSGTCVGAQAGEVMPSWSNGWQYFRPRVESGFVRFFWSADHRTWRVQSKDGTNLELGVPLDGSNYQGALEANPDSTNEIYRWYLARQYDGQINSADSQPVNTVVYRYTNDGNVAYLTDVFDTSPASAPTTTNLALFAHHTAIAYEARPDIAVSYRAGYPGTVEWRASRVDVTSKPFTGGSSAPRELVRRYYFGYDPTAHRSLLTSFQMEGRCATAVQEDGTQTLPPTSCPRLPALTFEYGHVQAGAAPLTDSQGLNFEPLASTVQTLAQSPSHSLDEADTGLLDVNGDGLPDVVSMSPGQYNGQDGLFLNGSGTPGAVGFGAALTMSVVPTADVPNAGVLRFSNPTVAALDLDSDGIVDILHMPASNQYSVFSPASDGAGGFRWVGRQIQTSSQQNPKINFTQNAPDVRVMDVDGDGLVDVVYSSATQLQTFFALGRFPGGDGQFGSAVWTSATTAQISNDPVAFCPPSSSTPIRFSDADVQIADMNGDGLPDIVRVRDGEVLYWPGRGNGFWGTGDRSGCGADPFAVNRQISMNSSPHFGTYDPGSLLLSDINGDGLADMVVVRSNAVEIYINDNGGGWTSADTINDTPFRAAQRTNVRLTDINGSGTPDILWGQANQYQYIDLTGGEIPLLLTTVHNGFGATMDLAYASSTTQMLAAAAAGNPWKMMAPVTIPVLVQTTQRDHLDAVGLPGGAYVKTYAYRDPVYEGRQREFRGFSDAVVTTVGDSNSPTSHQHTIFQLGECSMQFVGTPADVCTPPERWQDNWREPLKGLPVLNETYDDNGVYQGTEHTAYQLRQLYMGLDGRHVSAALATQMDRFLYDTASFDKQAAPTTLSEVAVNIPGISAVDTRSVMIRATAGTAHVLSTTAFDNFGNVTDAIGSGCVSGCPSGGVDEVTTTHSDFALPSGDTSGWLWRETHSYTVGNVNTARRHETQHNFNVYGDLATSYEVLSGTLPLARFHAVSGASIAPQPLAQSGGASTPVNILVESPSYDGFGNSTSDSGPSGRCSSRVYDPDYQQLSTVDRVLGGTASSTGCGQNVFSHSVSYDRGLGLVVDSVDPRHQPSHFTYDGFGRLTSITGPDPANPATLATQPSLQVSYQLPTDADTTPYTVTDVLRQDGANPDTASYRESQTARDGLGRTIVNLQQADTSAGDGGQWVASGAVRYDAKGATARTFDAVFYTGAISGALTGPPSGTPQKSQEYDAFGRPTLSYGFDQTIQLMVAPHALSTDYYDSADILPTVHQGTYTTKVVDGFGRPVQQVDRIKVSGTLEQRSTLFAYLPTNEVVSVTRRRAGSTDVVRWMQYDSLGRRVLNVEPNTSSSFNPSPATSPSAMKAWRYAYDDAGDLVGTSDARGCGANYFYDAAGRVVAEDRSPCIASQDPYTAPNLATGDGTEVFYRYDSADPDSTSVVDAAGHQLTIDTSQLWGRVASVSSLGAKSIFQYDALGRTTGVGRRLQLPGVATQQLSGRYAPTWYVRTATYDAADRPTSSGTGATVSALLGSDGTSALRTSYTKRGAVAQYAGSYGTLYASSVILADGRLQSFVLGDAAATQQYVTFDNNLRPQDIQTYRATAPLWSSPPVGSTYQPPGAMDDPTRQLLLEDRSFTYDEVGNLTRDEDDRLPGDWPAGAKPVTRTFQYDDLYRLTQTTYAYPGGTTDSWKAPFAAEDQSDAGPQPNPQVSFGTRITNQTFQYDWLGNLSQSTDDSQAFWDRSTGIRTMGTASAAPEQVQSASNRTLAPSSAAKGDLSAAYDAAGNLTDLIVRRDGTCLPSGASCWQRFAYDWDAVGELAHARRWDLSAASERSSNGQLTQAPPARSPDAELRFAYDGGGARVLKTAFAAGTAQAYTLYVFNTLEVRDTTFSTSTGDYVVDQNTASVRLFAGPVVARVEYAAANLPEVSGGHQHVLLEFGDRVGSTSFVIDYGTGELAEATTYQSYGALESDYRPSRWGSEREPYKFGGKEEDIELGLAYFGARYFSPYLATWISPDPATIHDLGSDLNPYAYVHGTPLMGVDPDGRFWVLLAVIAVVAIASAITNAVQQEHDTGHIDLGLVAESAGVSAASSAVGIGASFVLGPAALGLSAGVATALGGVAGSTVGYTLNQAVTKQPFTAAGLATSALSAVLTGGAGGAFAGAVGQGASAGLRAAAAGLGSSLMGAGLSVAGAKLSGQQAPSTAALLLGIGAGIATSVGSEYFTPALSSGGRTGQTSSSLDPDPGARTGPNGEPPPPRSDAELASAAAKQTADEAQGLSRPPGAAGAMVKDGATVTGVSGDRYGYPINPLVQAVGDDIPPNERSDNIHMQCVEPRCVSQMLDQGQDPEGATSSVVRVRPVTNPAHGTYMGPCPTCQIILRVFGVREGGF